MKLCLIGSGRFKETYAEYNRDLTLNGHVVYSIATQSSQVADHGLTQDEKETLDLVHLRKIQESEAVVVVTDESRYVGESTRRELKWARLLGREIFWHLKEIPAGLVW